MKGPLFAGIDGGGTKTAIVVVDADGNVVTRGTTTTSNSAVIGHEQAANVLRTLLESTAADCDFELPFTSAWFGLSGSDRPEDHRQLRPRLEGLAETMTMTNDAELALGGLPNRVGVAMVAGTGSICFGQNAAGKQARAGGWGHIFSDEGSGYGIAVDALRAFAAEHDGIGPETTLTQRLIEHWKIEDPFTIINRVYDPKTTKGDIASMSRIVVEEAAEGDEVSRRILEQGAESLAGFAAAVAKRLELGPELDIACVGGMLVQVEPYRERVLHLLREHWIIPDVSLIEEPALAAAQALAQDYRENPS
jgi:N-acetylglucosamine kinase-like BadF-type ATPase